MSGNQNKRVSDQYYATKTSNLSEGSHKSEGRQCMSRRTEARIGNVVEVNRMPMPAPSTIWNPVLMRPAVPALSVLRSPMPTMIRLQPM